MLNGHEVLIVGGIQRDINRIKKIIKEYKVNNVTLMGFIPPPQIPNFLRAADVLVLPSSSKTEKSCLYTSPLKLFEYMAARKPIVASRLPALQEILVDGESAVLCTPDNPEELAKSLKFLLSNKDLAEKFSERSFEIVQNYTWTNRSRQILKFTGLIEI